MLLKEYKFLISVLSSFVNEAPFVYSEEIKREIDECDIQKLAGTAKAGEIGGIVYNQLKKAGCDNSRLMSLTAPMFSAAVYTYQQRKNALNKISELFSREKTDYLLFKGFEIASFYPLPMLRTMGDCDILVHPGDKQKAHGILEKIGMTRKADGPNEWIYDYNGLEYELHHRLMNDEAGNHNSHKAFMNRHWDYAVKDTANPYFHHLDINYHFVFLILHLRKHFINSGVGIRQFLDLAVVIKNCELDWEWIKQELDKADLTEFARICISLCERWFKVSSPLTVALDDEFYNNAAKNIFENGVFGFDNSENRDNYLILRVNEGGASLLSRFRVVLEGLFPPYTLMRQVPKYAFIDKKPLLLPIAWGYRFITSIKNRNAIKEAKSVSKGLTIDKDKVASRTDYLKQWKL